MDHAMGTVPAEAPAQGAERPGWWLTIGTLFVAALISFAGELLLAVVTAPFKLDMAVLIEQAPASYGDGTLWGFVATAWPALVAALLFGQGLRLAASMHSDWQVRATPVTLVVLLMLVIGDGAEASETAGGRGFWAIVVLVLVARYVAFTRARAPFPRSRPLAALIGVVAVALSAAALAYPAFHPLHVQVGDMVNGSGVEYGFASDADRDPRMIDVGIDLRSPADARIRSIRTDLAAGAPVVVEVENDASAADAPGYLPLPPQGVAVPDGDAPPYSLHARLRLRPGTCAPGPGRIQVPIGSLSVELETLGMRRTQHVTLPRPVTLSCRR